MNELLNFINHHLQSCLIIFVYIAWLAYIAIRNKSIKRLNKIPFLAIFTVILLHYFVGKAFIGQVLVMSVFLFFLDLYFLSELDMYEINNMDNIIFTTSCIIAPFFLLTTQTSIIYALILSTISYGLIRLYILKFLNESQRPEFNLDNLGFILIGCSVVLGFSNYLLNLILMFCLFLPYVLFFGIFNEQDKLKNLNLVILFFISINLYLILLLIGFKVYVPLPNL